MIILSWLWIVSAFAASKLEAPILVYPGYLTRIRCQGRLLASASGNPSLMTLEPLPKEMGCGVLLQSHEKQGRTNLILETTTGTIHQIVEIRPLGKTPPNPQDLERVLEGVDR
ncbi:hypothetical protein WDW37_16480 [Bdellovibrionota bacterium FG-1]